MKFILFFIVLMILFAVLSAVLINIFGTSTTNTPKETPRNVRNYKVRFDAVAEKYYIVNELSTHDEAVENWLGRRVMYADKPKAEFVVQKLNA